MDIMWTDLLPARWNECMALTGVIEAALSSEPPGPPPTIRVIIEQTAAKYGVTYLDIISHRRTKCLIGPRHEAMWRCCVETTHSLPTIARHFGGRDHTTVWNGRRQHQKRIDAGQV